MGDLEKLEVKALRIYLLSDVKKTLEGGWRQKLSVTPIPEKVL